MTIEGETRSLAQPFIVLATQNPIEQEGTYPLPEAQVDRFLIKLRMGYPEPADEKRMLQTYDRMPPPPRPVVGPGEVMRMQQLAQEVFVAEELVDYILALTHFTRSHARVYLGASPRAALALMHASKALALIRGRDYVVPADLDALVRDAFRHRLVLSYRALAEEVMPDALLDQVLAAVPLPQIDLGRSQVA